MISFTLNLRTFLHDNDMIQYAFSPVDPGLLKQD